MSDLLIFNNYPISDNQSAAMQAVSGKCEELHNLLISYFESPTPYTSICQTKLEEFALFANKAISRDAKA